MISPIGPAFSRWDLRPPTAGSRPGTGEREQGMDAKFPSAFVSAESWSPCDDGEGNIYYVNDATGESAWELPMSAVQQDLVENWGEATEPTTDIFPAFGIANGAEGGEDTARWGDGLNGGGMWASVPDPFGEYTQPAAQSEYSAVENYWGDEGTGDWVSTPQQEGVAEGWTQVWDEDSQSYYWYNDLTGESRW